MLFVHDIQPRSSFTQLRHMYSALHGNEKLKIAFTRALPMDINLSQNNPIDIMASCILFAAEIVPQKNSYEALCNIS